jgi:hypothetical protein
MNKKSIGSKKEKILGLISRINFILCLILFTSPIIVKSQCLNFCESNFGSKWVSKDLIFKNGRVVLDLDSFELEHPGDSTEYTYFELYCKDSTFSLFSVYPVEYPIDSSGNLEVVWVIGSHNGSSGK